MRRAAKYFSIGCLTVAAFMLLAATVQACPMCSQSIAEEDLLPHAYMYSILFMLAMPATVFTGIGTVIFFKFRKSYGLVSTAMHDANASDIDAAA